MRRATRARSGSQWNTMTASGPMTRFGTLSRKVANQLMIDSGLAAGARIACYMPNDPMFFVCQIGIHRTPYVWLPLSSRASVFENIDIMKAFDAEFLFFHSAFERDIPSIRQELPQIKYFVCVRSRRRRMYVLVRLGHLGKRRKAPVCLSTEWASHTPHDRRFDWKTQRGDANQRELGNDGEQLSDGPAL